MHLVLTIVALVGGPSLLAGPGRPDGATARHPASNESDHYVVEPSGAEKRLVEKMLAELEAVRREAEAIVPPSSEAKGKVTVRICLDHADYVAAGGGANSAALADAKEGRIVLLDLQGRGRERRAKNDMLFRILRQQAFSVYVRREGSDCPVAPWFERGHGELFGEAEVDKKGLVDPTVSKDRLRTLEHMLDDGRWMPLMDLLSMDEIDLYKDVSELEEKTAQCWAFVYYLRTSPHVEKDPLQSRILLSYVDALRREYGPHAKADEEPTQGKVSYGLTKAVRAAREKALQSAMEGIDLAALEQDWKDFVRRFK